jgi:hypothetical protein
MTEPVPAAPLDEIIEDSEIPVPNRQPHNITFAIVAWNESERLPRLLSYVRPYFRTLAVVVQESNDGTEDIAKEMADIFVTDRHHGYGDASFGPKLLPLVRTSWTFKCDADEWPSVELLETLTSAAWYAEKTHREGVWVPFRSAVDGVEYNELHSHLRLFKTSLGWPSTLHSRPMTDNTILWHTGFVRHDRTLDEMMQDYLRYWVAGRGNTGWDAHNKLMMYHACKGTAEQKGWDYVRSFPWWADVAAIAFTDEQPWR